ncbi:hypothetical protein PM082_016609 [Marasmius tenuissimus]|nr:hypothetical protein PM082_016609 [Marasmius tenuissimus]
MSTPPLDPTVLLDPTVSESDPWNPGASAALNVTTNVPSLLPSMLPPPPPPTLVVEPWKLAHTSHHEFYELDRSIPDDVLFQVKLYGVMPAFKDKKYKYNKSSSSWFSVYFLQDSGGSPRVLAMDWQRIKGRLPKEIVIFPQWPMQKTNLPLTATQGEFKDSVVTKVTGVGTNLHVLPLVASTGDVDTNASTFKVSCGDCCIIRLQKSAHEKWKQFKVAAWWDARANGSISS